MVNSAQRTGSYSFLDFTLDSATERLLRGTTQIKLRPKSYQVMRYLVEHHSRLVTREELLAAVWGDVAVTEESITKCIADIRKALGDDSQEIVRTVPRRGFLFQAEVRSIEPAQPATVSTPASAESPNRKFVTAALLLVALAAGGLLLVGPARIARREPAYTPITNFADSAVAPALSPDGRMVAFLRSDTPFLTSGQIYVKLLPNGEPVQLTHDPRRKYAPAFSPDGSLIAFSMITAPTRDGWATYVISPFGGEPRLLLPNASGLTWIDGRRTLFSEIKTGMHMGVVTATAARSDSRDVYWPEHERMMAHFSYASPDLKWALVVEMNPKWEQCRLVPLDGSSRGRKVGPKGMCTSAGWSPDGKWMFFGVRVEDTQHLWRQRFPDGEPEQITSGPTEEDGVAVAPDGRSLITSVGMKQGALWLHDAKGDQAVSSEGYATNRGFGSEPLFSLDCKSLYYLLRRESLDAPRTLWRTDLESHKSTELLPGFSIQEFDISSDGKQAVFAVQTPDGQYQIWLALLDRSSPPMMIASSAHGESSPHFGPDGEILFRHSDGKANYLFRMKPDGTGRAPVVTYPISTVQSISRDRRWLAAIVPVPSGAQKEMRGATVAIPTTGGDPRRICAGACPVQWAPDGKFLYIWVPRSSEKEPDKTVAIPIPPGETMPKLPDSGIHTLADAAALPGTQVIDHPVIIPGSDPSMYAYVKTTVHRNLFRVPLSR